MVGIIWTPVINSDITHNEFQNIIKKYKDSGINVAVQHNSRICPYVEFENGDIWKAMGTKENSRASRCNISYIHRSVDNAFTNLIIRHCTTMFPFQAYNYWGNKDDFDEL